MTNTPEEETFTKESKFPKGWDEARVRRVLASYEEQAGEEAVAGDAAAGDSSEAVIHVPREV